MLQCTANTGRNSQAATHMHGWRHAGAQPASGGGSGPVEFALEVGHDFLALLSRLQQQSESSFFMAYMQQQGAACTALANTICHMTTCRSCSIRRTPTRAVFKAGLLTCTSTSSSCTTGLNSAEHSSSSPAPPSSSPSSRGASPCAVLLPKPAQTQHQTKLFNVFLYR